MCPADSNSLVPDKQPGVANSLPSGHEVPIPSCPVWCQGKKMGRLKWRPFLPIKTIPCRKRFKWKCLLHSWLAYRPPTAVVCSFVVSPNRISHPREAIRDWLTSAGLMRRSCDGSMKRSELLTPISPHQAVVLKDVPFNRSVVQPKVDQYKAETLIKGQSFQIP